MGIPENIDALLVKYDITQSSLAEIAGVSSASVNAWRHGSTPRRKYVEKICEYFDLTPDDILSDQHGLAAKEHGRDVSEPFDVMASKGSHAPLVTLGKVHAGEFEEEVIDQRVVTVPSEVLEAHPSACAVIVNGDCMNRVIPNGCVIVFDPNMEPHNGSIVIVETEEYDAIMRRWFLHNKTLVLAPDSYADYDDIVIRGDERPIRVIGVVVWFQADAMMD